MRKILLVLLTVLLMLGYVWMRSISNKLTEKVANLQEKTEILDGKLERDKIALSKKLLVSSLEPKARRLGLFYPWETDYALKHNLRESDGN